MTAIMDYMSSTNCVVASVCVAGVVMAYLCDEEHSEPSSVLQTGKRVPANDEEINGKPSILQNVFRMFDTIFKAFQKGNIVNRFFKWITSWLEFAQFLWSARALKAVAKSRRQFFYMLEKQLLGLDISKGETEVKSYLDVKRHLGRTWPFMWKVSEVKSQHVECDGYKCYPMSSYSYLDLLRHSEVEEAAIQAARAYSTGNHGPRMLGGNMRILCDLEQTIADFFGRDGTLLCATGFLACMSVACAVASEGDVIFADSRAHASLRSGLKLCGAKIINFKHNDYGHLGKLARKHRKKYNNAWLMIEGVYSMDGDIADLPAAHKIASKFDMRIILDEAHGLGVVGKTGRGLEEHFNMPGVCTIICGTFSKSIASIGGYICGPKDLIDFMDFHAPGNVFSAPLPAYCAGAALKAFELIDSDKEGWRVKKAQDNSRYLRECLESGMGCWPEGYPEESKYELEGDVVTTVIPVVFPDDIDRVMRVATHLKENGWMVAAVAFPACPLRRPRFRITATSAYDDKLIVSFVKALVHATVEIGPSESALQMKNLQAL